MTSNWTYFLKKKEELEIDSGIVVLLFNFCLCIFIENQDCLHHWVPPCVQQGLGFKDFWKGGSFSALIPEPMWTAILGKLCWIIHENIKFWLKTYKISLGTSMPPFNVGYYKGTSFSELKLFIQPCTVNKPVTKWYFDLIIF